MRSADVLHPTAPLLDYGYADATCPIPFQVVHPVPTAALGIGPGGPIPSGSAKPMTTPQPELVGATLSAVQLEDQVAHVAVPTPVTPHAFRSATASTALSLNATARQLVQNVTLHLEQVTSSDVAPTYDVFLNVPPGEDPNNHEDRYVARVAMFGIKQASDLRGSHAGSGHNYAFDITELYHRLADSGEIDPKNLRVSFVPVSPIGKPHVTVGRISLYFA